MMWSGHARQAPAVLPETTMMAWGEKIRLIVWALALLAFSTTTRALEQQQAYNGVTPEELSKMMLDDTYVVPPNNTYVPFFFTNVGSWSVPRFQITLTSSSSSVSFRWNDVFCAGDRFTVYFLTSSPGSLNVTNSGTSPAGVPSCSIFYTTDPAVANGLNAFTRGTITTNRPGVYNITIIPIVSPFSAGKAYIRVTYNS